MKIKKENAKRDGSQLLDDLSIIKDKELLKHEEKRKILLKVSEFRDTLEDEGELDDEAIELKCKEFKKELLRPKEILASYKKREDRLDESEE